MKNSTSSNNIGVGSKAGWNIITGSNNIDIGSMGAANDANSIRIGTQGTQRATYIAGIFGTPMSGGGDVVVNSSGQLGVLPSSARYKRDVRSLNNRSQGLWQLRPVTFRYKQDPQGQRQYGLIAEEVARVYPELVVRGDKGEIESVQYRELIPLMLNEMQKQAKETRQQLETKDRQLAAQDRQLAAQQREIDALKQKDASINTLSERLAALEQQMRTANSARFDSLARK